MTASEFVALCALAGFDVLEGGQRAKRDVGAALSVSERTVYRWATGRTPIGPQWAAWVRARLQATEAAR